MKLFSTPNAQFNATQSMLFHGFPRRFSLSTNAGFQLWKMDPEDSSQQTFVSENDGPWVQLRAQFAG